MDGAGEGKGALKQQLAGVIGECAGRNSCCCGLADDWWAPCALLLHTSNGNHGWLNHLLGSLCITVWMSGVTLFGLCQTEAEGGVLVEELDDATHAVLRHQEQPEYQQAADLMTVNVVPPEWVLHSATAHERQPEVGGCAGPLWAKPACACSRADTASLCQKISCFLLNSSGQACAALSHVPAVRSHG